RPRRHHSGEIAADHFPGKAEGHRSGDRLSDQGPRPTPCLWMNEGPDSPRGTPGPCSGATAVTPVSAEVRTPTRMGFRPELSLTQINRVTTKAPRKDPGASAKGPPTGPSPLPGTRQIA